MASHRIRTARRAFLFKGGTAAAVGVAATTIGLGGRAAADPFVPAYLPIGPIRVYDSRKPGGRRLTTGQVDTLAMGSFPEDLAYTFNLTATATAGSGGYLSVFPADKPWPGTSSINWYTSGMAIANNVFTGTWAANDNSIKVLCGSGSTHYILDLIGVSTIVDLAAALTSDGGVPAPTSVLLADPSSLSLTRT
jgi:hypothetical protein